MNDFFRILFTIMGIAAILAILGVLYVLWRVKRLNVPENASFTQTLLRVPFSLVLVLDLLDLGFDIFATPISWWLLGRLNLQALRRVTVAEAFIPGTQMIPTLTVAWLGVRLFNNEDRGRVIPHDDSQV